MPTNPVFTPVDGSGNVIGQVASADSLPAGSVPGVAGLLWNGTTWDRPRGSNGSPSVLTQAAFSVYAEAPVVNGARLTTGNITGGSIPNNASLFLVSVVVTAFTGTSVTYSLQVQDANTNWVTLGSTASITATGTYVFSVGPGMTNANLLVPGSGNWRVSWVASALTALTSQIGVTGR
jgi:hypothetical protein